MFVPAVTRARSGKFQNEECKVKNAKLEKQMWILQFFIFFHSSFCILPPPPPPPAVPIAATSLLSRVAR